jgi:hypothetical protein
MEHYEQTLRVLAARLLEAFPGELTLHNNVPINSKLQHADPGNLNFLKFD